MQTTLDLPEELVRRLGRRAVHDGRTPEQVAAELLAAGLPSDSASPPGAGAVVPKHHPRIKARLAARADVNTLSGQAWTARLGGVQPPRDACMPTGFLVQSTSLPLQP